MPRLTADPDDAIVSGPRIMLIPPRTRQGNSLDLKAPLINPPIHQQGEGLHILRLRSGFQKPQLEKSSALQLVSSRSTRGMEEMETPTLPFLPPIQQGIAATTTPIMPGARRTLHRLVPGSGHTRRFRSRQLQCFE